MTRNEFLKEMQGIVAHEIDKPESYYRRRGRIEIVGCILSYLFAVVTAYIFVIVVFGGYLNNASVILWLVVSAGVLILINSFFDLARNFSFGAMMDFYRLRLLKGEAETSPKK